MSGTSETFCRIAINRVYSRQKTTLSALRINPRKKILGAAKGGLSHRWLDYQFGCIDILKPELHGHEESEAIVGPGLTRPKRMS